MKMQTNLFAGGSENFKQTPAYLNAVENIRHDVAISYASRLGSKSELFAKVVVCIPRQKRGSEKNSSAQQSL